MQRIKHPQVIMVILCCIFFSLSAFFVNYMMTKNRDINIHYLYDVNQQSRKTIMKQVQGDLQTLTGIAIFIGNMRDIDMDYLLQTVKQVNDHNGFMRMGIINRQGIVDLVDINGEFYRSVDVSREAFFQRALAGESTISDTMRDSITKRYMNYYAVPIWKDGAVAAVLCAVNATDVLSGIIDTSILGGNGFSHIVKENGDYAIRSMHPSVVSTAIKIREMGTIEEPILDKILSDLRTGESGFFEYEAHGEARWSVYAPIGINGWSVFTIIPRNALQQNYNDTITGIVAIITAALLVFAFLFYQMKAMSQKNRKTLEYLAYTDKLTEYPNYDRFLLDAPDLLKNAGQRRYAFWYCDLKNFKYFNDRFGYKRGDSVLRYLADKVKVSLSQNEIFCRMFADNYVGLMFYQDKDEILSRFERLVETMEDYEESRKYGYRVEVSVGIYCYDAVDGILSVDEMLNRANMAQKSVKFLNGSRCAFYSNSIHNAMVREAEIESRMRDALENEEFEVYLQPKVDIQDGNRIVGAEVLARWNCSQIGMITPGEFIPIFERNGFIIQLDRYMFEHTCKWIRKTLDEGKAQLKFSVNVSRSGLLQEGFLSFYIGTKVDYCIPDGVLELEFTESMALDNNEAFRDIIITLKEHGFDCSMDDFGSGYSSLNILKDLPMDILKLDMLFFRKGIDRDKERIVIRNVIAMARELRMSTVSEGVEYTDQVDFLKSVGCNVVQGYIFAKPMPIHDFEKLVQKNPEGIALELR